MRKTFLFVLLLTGILSAACNAQKPRGKIDTFTTKDGKKVVITPIKHGSLQINYDGIEFEIDPVASAVGEVVDYSDKPKADYILITHDHYDHFDPTTFPLLMKQNTDIILTPRCYNRIKTGTVMRNGEKADLGHGITLYALPAYNTTKSHMKYHPRGWGNGYLLDLNGFRIYVAGDTEDIPEMKDLKDIDIAFLPCNQPFTMTVKQLRHATEMIRPKVLYPYHFSNTDKDSMEQVGKGLDIDVRIYDFE